MTALCRWHQYYSPDDPTRRKPVDIRDLLEGHSVVAVMEKTLRPSNRLVDIAIAGLVKWVGVIHHNQLVGLEISTKRFGESSGTYDGVTYFTVSEGCNAIFVDPKHLVWPSAEDYLPRMASFITRLVKRQPRPAWIFLSWKYRVKMILQMLRMQQALARITRPCVFVWGQNKYRELSLDSRNAIARYPELLREPRSVAKRVATICPSYQHTVVLTTSGCVYTAGAPLTNLLGHSYKGRFFRPVSVLDPNQSHKPLYEDVAALRATLGGGSEDDIDAEGNTDESDHKARFDTWNNASLQPSVRGQNDRRSSAGKSAVPVDAQAASASSFRFPSLYSPQQPQKPNQSAAQPARSYRTGSMRRGNNAQTTPLTPSGANAVYSTPVGTRTRSMLTPTDPSAAQALPKIKFKSDRVLTVAAGGMHTVAMLESGRVVTWGGRLYGKLGTSDPAVGDEEIDTEAQQLGGGEESPTNEIGGIWSGVPGVPAKRSTNTEALLALLSDDPEGRTAGVLEHISTDAEGKDDADPNSNLKRFALRYALPGLDLRTGVPKGFNIVALKPGKQACSVACGQTFTVVCTTDGELYTFGGAKDHAYVLGHGPNSAPVSTPTRVDTQGHQVVQVVCGELHTLALTRERRVLAWGKNDFGQLGLGRFTNVHTPELITAAYEDGDRYGYIPAGSGSLQHREVLQIAAGGQHSMLVVLSRGERYRPELDIGLERYAQRRRSLDHMLDERQSGDLYTFGSGVNGQLGHGHTAALGLPGMSLDDGGAMGSPGGQMGEFEGASDGALKSSACPRRVVGLPEPVVQAAAGLMHSLCLTPSGRVYSWGSGAHGQLGDGQFNAVNRPVWVSALRHVRIAHIAAGGNHSAASTRPFRNMMQMRQTYRLSEKRLARRLSQDLGVADALLSEAERANLARQRELETTHRDRHHKGWDSAGEFDDYLSDSEEEENNAYYEGVDVDDEDGYVDDAEESDPEDEGVRPRIVGGKESPVRLAVNPRELGAASSAKLAPSDTNSEIYVASLDNVYALLNRTAGSGGNESDRQHAFSDYPSIPAYLPPASMFKTPQDVQRFIYDVLKLDISITHTPIGSTIQRMVTFQTYQQPSKLQETIAKFSGKFAIEFNMMADNVTFRAGCVTATLAAAAAAGKPLDSSNLRAGSGGVVLNGVRGINAGSAAEQTSVTAGDIARLGLSSQDTERLRKLGIGSLGARSTSETGEPISSKNLSQCTYLSTCRLQPETRAAIQALVELKNNLGEDDTVQVSQQQIPEVITAELARLNAKTATWAYEFYRSVVQPARESVEDKSKMQPQTAGSKVPIWQRVAVCEVRPMILSIKPKQDASHTSEPESETNPNAALGRNVEGTGEVETKSCDGFVVNVTQSHSSSSGPNGEIDSSKISVPIEAKQMPKTLTVGDEELAECLYLSPAAAPHVQSE